MFLKSINRNRLIKLFVLLAMTMMISNICFAGDFRYEPRSEDYWPSNLVRAVQDRLKELGFDPGPADGIYGSKTKNGIMEFQHFKNIEVDGKISNQLIGALDLGQ